MVSGWQATVGGATLDGRQGTLGVEQLLMERSRASLQLWDPGCTQHPSAGQRVYVTDRNTGLRLFGGLLVTDEERLAANGKTSLGGGIAATNTTPTLLHSLTCTDFHGIAARLPVAKTYTNQRVDQIVTDLYTTYLQPEGILAALGANLLTRGQSWAEQGVAEYLAHGGATLAWDTAHAWQGLHSVRVYADGTAGYQGISVVRPQSVWTAGATYTMSAYVYSETGCSLRYYLWQQTPELNVGGVVTTTIPAGVWTRLTQSGAMPNPLAAGSSYGLQIESGTANGSTPITFWLDGLQIEMAVSASTWQLGGPSTIDTGVTTFGSVVLAYAYLSDCLDALAAKSGMVWNIDENAVFTFQTPGSVVAAWNPTGADMQEESIAVTNGNNTLYRNGQYILGGMAETTTQTETRKGDGVTTTFVVAYPLASVPAITVNGVTQTVGIRQVDSGKAWYWQENDRTLSQDTGGTPLATTDTWVIDYVGLWPNVVYSEDLGEVMARQAIEGGGTGHVQNVYQDASLTTTTDAFDTAAGLLGVYAQAGRRLVFQSRRSGLAVGALANVTLPAHGFTNTPMLVVSVKPVERPAEFWWQYTLVEGPVIGSWVTIFLRLAASILRHVDTLNLGSSQTLALLAAVSESWGWSESVSATAYVCPVLPFTLPATLC